MAEQDRRELVRGDMASRPVEHRRDRGEENGQRGWEGSWSPSPLAAGAERAPSAPANRERGAGSLAMLGLPPHSHFSILLFSVVIYFSQYPVLCHAIIELLVFISCFII